MDSTTIDLCLSVFKWAKFRKAKGAVKLHTLLDLKTDIPVFIHISDGKMHDINALDMIEFENGAFYVMDKAYIDFAGFYQVTVSGAFFVTRGKENLSFRRLYSSKVEKATGLRCDQTIKLTRYKSSKLYPLHLRRIRFYDAENNRTLVFLTNNFEVDALTIALLYKHRMQIELFFKWINSICGSKHFGEHQPMP